MTAVLVGICIILNIFDAGLTWWGVGVAKYAVEMNPVVLAGVASIGWFWTMFIKLAVTTAGFLLLYQAKQEKPRLIKWAMIVFTGFFLFLMGAHALAYSHKGDVDAYYFNHR